MPAGSVGKGQQLADAQVDVLFRDHPGQGDAITWIVVDAFIGLGFSDERAECEKGASGQAGAFRFRQLADPHLHLSWVIDWTSRIPHLA